MDYNVAQAFCSHITPKAVLLFTGEALKNDTDFEPEDGEGYDDKYKGGYGEVVRGIDSPFPGWRRRRVNADDPF